MTNQSAIMTPELKALYEAGKQLGVKFNTPIYNCKKCYGRGWIGKDSKTQEPIPCPCILPKETRDRDIGAFHYKARNRAERRQQMKEDLKYWSKVYKNVKTNDDDNA